jgi:hypothetical protein
MARNLIDVEFNFNCDVGRGLPARHPSERWDPVFVYRFVLTPGVEQSVPLAAAR